MKEKFTNVFSSGTPDSSCGEAGISLFLNSSFKIGSLTLPNRLIQGPLAGYSCAPFRQLYYDYTPPAYCVSEMVSAQDVLHKHQLDSRYLYRAPEENLLCYQLSGSDPLIMAQAAYRLQTLGADLIDINCGCPKLKIRKKGAGSALLDTPQRLFDIVDAIRTAISIPLTVKIRVAGNSSDIDLAKGIEHAGANALVVHGRRWIDDYDKPSDLVQIAMIKQSLHIPVIANGDLSDAASLARAIKIAGCDGYMIGRGGSGQPWLYQELLMKPGQFAAITHADRLSCFKKHLRGLARLESEHKAVLQSKSLIRYYFKKALTDAQLQLFYALDNLHEIEAYIDKL